MYLQAQFPYIPIQGLIPHVSNITIQLLAVAEALNPNKPNQA